VRVSHREFAPMNSTFGKSSFTSALGKLVPIRANAHVIGEARLVAVEVDRTGESALLTWEIAETTPT
jgi:hypothetical protein